MQAENAKQYRLGYRAFFIFLLKRMRGPVIVLLIALGIWYAKRWIPAGYASWGDYVLYGMLILSGAILLVLFIRTLIEYRFYRYSFTEDAFVMISGYVTHNETATLYHQIQNVNIKRTISDRLVGVSELVIVMAGMSGSESHRVFLPALEKTRAKMVQQELITRARKHFNTHGTTA
ncbi:MAG TPA: PH domain-containing protein [Candidatus Paceibacterota bacterium]|nr:PH domain-containing protein [Candidatus Paceibacterota bacterium]